MAVFAVDASLSLGWAFSDEATEYTEGLLDRLAAGEEVAVPSHWPLEVLNGLIQAKKRRRISEEGVQSFIASLASFQIVIDAERDYLHLHSIRDLAERHGLTSYDAAYLELAIRLSLPMATLDTALRKASAAEHVPLV